MQVGWICMKLGLAKKAPRLWARQAAEAEFAQKMQDSVYNVMAMDIESTVAGAVSKCSADTSVSKEVRRERLMGLLKLGKIFQTKVVDL